MGKKLGPITPGTNAFAVTDYPMYGMRGAFKVELPASDMHTFGMVLCERGPFHERAEEMSANAHLYADAHNTANATGLLPSELLEQRDELMQKVREAMHFYLDCMEFDKAQSLESLLTKLNTK